MTEKERLHELVERFRANQEQYVRPSYNETEVRVDFVNPLFELLGWDVLNQAGLPQYWREVRHEANVMVREGSGARKKKPDYAFKRGTETCFFLETKKPSVHIVEDERPAFQLRRYGWSGNLKISILTNFVDLIIYDCGIRPVEGDQAGKAVIAHYHYTEYEDKLDELQAMISKAAVLSGQFDAAFSTVSTAVKKEPFDWYFLEQIRKWRNWLCSDVAEHNDMRDDELNIFVQRLLNKVVFLRICEDRELEAYETLKEIKTYQELKRVFRMADQKYDSGLFDLMDERGIEVSDAVIRRIFEDLYYPNSSYEFSMVDPYIIGQIYAIFLEESVFVRPDGTVDTVKKPEAVQGQGAVNTPKSMTDMIVKETLDELYANQDMETARRFRVADICCGAGNFLLSAYEYILNFYMRQGHMARVPFRVKREIMVNNLWGVDIDPLAVEVTKLSLALKLLENTSEEELEEFAGSSHERLLPHFENNIKNGNSLIDERYLSYHESAYSDLDLMRTLKLFNFQEEFGFREFDAIIGNPPYIRVQHMVHYSPEEYGYYRSETSGFDCSKESLMDKYYLFIERGLALLAATGVMGYIIPNKFMVINAGQVLRQRLSQGAHVKRLFHFGTCQVFENRTTYTCVLILTKVRNRQFSFCPVSDLGCFLFQGETAAETYTSQYLTGNPWTFMSRELRRALSRIEPRCVPLNQVADVFVGLQTSADDIYVIQGQEDESFVYFQDKRGDQTKIERGLLREGLYDAKITKYQAVEPNAYLLFPYRYEAGCPILYPEEELRRRFPYGYAYLKKFRGELDLRKMKRTEESWYAYGRSQSLRRFGENSRHLIWPVLSLGPNYVYDDQNIAFTGGGNGPYYGLAMKADAPFSVFYIQAILNYWLMERLVKANASKFRGDYYSHGKQFVNALPIYWIHFDQAAEREAYEWIIEAVRRCMSLNQEWLRARTRADRDVIERMLRGKQREINRTLDGLYQIKSEEMSDFNETYGEL